MTVMSESGNDYTGDIQGWEPPPLPPKPTYENVCDICGQTFKGLQGVSMHKVRSHGQNWSGRKKTAEDREKKRARDRRNYADRKARERGEVAEKRGDLVLRQVFEENGRILLVAESDGSWWVAQRWEM